MEWISTRYERLPTPRTRVWTYHEQWKVTDWFWIIRDKFNLVWAWNDEVCKANQFVDFGPEANQRQFIDWMPYQEEQPDHPDRLRDAIRHWQKCNCSDCTIKAFNCKKRLMKFGIKYD